MAVTLIVEDGTTVTDANTYISLADAETYMESRLNVTVWDAATTDNKNRALVQATRTIDSSVNWKGVQVNSTTQSLDWPRDSVEIEGNKWPTTSVPQDVREAVAELALFMLTGDRTTDAGSAGIDEIGLGDGALEIKFNNQTEADILPDTVKTGLGDWITSAGSRRGQIPTTRV